MKHIFSVVLALALMNGTAVLAQSANQNATDQSDSRDKKDKDKEKEKKDADKKDADKHDADRQDTAKKDADKKDVDKRDADRQDAAKKDADQRDRDAAAKDKDRATQQTNPVLPITPADRNAREQRSGSDTRNQAKASNDDRRWSKGDRVPEQYRQSQFVVSDWQQQGLRQPPRGYHWVRNDHNDYYLAAILGGLITLVVLRDDRDDNWRRHYSRHYTYDDDVYYRDCRNSPDPAGVLVGALIGGFLGNQAGHGNRTGATFAGVIIGAGIGAALTSNMDCEDRSYAYRSYYDGFNSGRSNRHYRWSNPHNNHRGDFRVRSYFNDPYGFRCARFTQVVYIQGRQYQTRGVACRQPDGAWTVVS